MFEVLSRFIVPIIILGVAYLLKARSGAAANGAPVSQVNLIPESWAEPLRPQGRRRMLVVAWVALILFAVVSIWTKSVAGPFPVLGAWWVGMAISHSTRTMAEQHADMLDERMVAARNQAFRTAYYSLGGIVAIGLFLIGLFGETLWDGSTVTLDTAAFTGAALLSIVTGMYLPSVILAWTEDVI